MVFRRQSPELPSAADALPGSPPSTSASTTTIARMAAVRASEEIRTFDMMGLFSRKHKIGRKAPAGVKR